MTPEQIKSIEHLLDIAETFDPGSTAAPLTIEEIAILRALLAEWEERSAFAKEADRCWHAETMAKLKAEAEIERLKADIAWQEERNANNVRAYMEEIERLRKAHEALLNTLGASKHPWIAKVHKNAAAHYAVLRGEGEK